MKTLTKLTALIPFLLLATPGFCADETPATIAVPKNQTLTLTLNAKGDQIYECRCIATTPDKFGWVVQPDADLFDEQGHKVGHHSIGPKWQLDGGDLVVGKLHSKAPSPDGKSLPWLLLDATEASGKTFGKVKSIQRINTAGGQEPDEIAESTKLGQKRRVKYSATYKFYAE